VGFSAYLETVGVVARTNQYQLAHVFRVYINNKQIIKTDEAMGYNRQQKP